ncbi:MAG: Gfo/Idh/MocA family protein [Oscillospiraceae bacterium]
MAKQLTVAIAGLGSRGRQTYAKYAEKYPDQLKVVAVADPIPERVAEAAETFGIPPGRCFSTAEELVAQDKLADLLFICTPDREHVKPAVPALYKGYDILLEKPISPLSAECAEMLAAAKETGRRVVVCHVLRYTPFYQELKRLLDDGAVGEIVSIQAIENVGYAHQAHSFVRGNWRNSEETSPMILQKCCHDMDILLWLTGKELRKVSSYGGLYLFRPEKAPVGSALRCLDGCKVKDSCPYDAEKIYITGANGVIAGKTGWPLDVLTMHPTEASIREALEDGPYGRCVYHCDNNVVDHQVINLELEGGVTVNFTMCAFTSKTSRYTKVMGTMGEIIADMGENTITILPFVGEPKVIDVAKLADDFGGHGGGDDRMVADLIGLVSGERKGAALTSVDQSVASHYACFAAEQSRLNSGESVDITTMMNSL